MTNTNPNEIDLSETLHILWDGKWIICLITVSVFMFGLTYVYFKKQSFEARINYTVDILPPFHSNSSALQEFEKKFFSRKTFNDWKENRSNVTLLFDNISSTNVIDGYLFTKEKNSRMTTSISIDDFSSTLLARTNQLSIIEDIYDYAIFVNDTVTSKYYQRTEVELEMIELQYRGFLETNNQLIKQLFALDRFKSEMEDGTKIFIISPPTKPIQTSQNIYSILIMSAFLGAITGISLIIISHLFQKKQRASQ